MMAESWGVIGYQMQPPTFQSSPAPPKVGFGVVCRCPGSGVQCLLQKRGLTSASPNKWSFPGGRLEHPGDLDEDGDVGTRRELEEECGGGEPHGLPSLIHIECYKSGKVKQTIYHVYAVDTSANKEWELWKPKPKNEKASEVDTMATELVVNNQVFPSLNGYCWVDMHSLIQECDQLTSSQVDMMDATDLQHGLVRWVQNYGDHVLRTLIQRSPKLPHHSPRRHSSSSTSSSSGTNGSSRSKSDVTPKLQRYRTTPDILTPPFMPLRPAVTYQAPLVAANHSPTHHFYGMGLPIMSPTAMGASNLVGNQQAAMQFMRFPFIPSSSSGVASHLGTGHQQPQQQQAIAVAHAAGQSTGMVYHQLPQQFRIQQPQQPVLGAGPTDVMAASSLVIPSLPPPGVALESTVAGSIDGGTGNSNLTSELGTTASESSSDSGSGSTPSAEMINKLMQIQQQQRPMSAFHQVNVPPLPTQPLTVAGTSFLEQQQQLQGGGVGGGNGVVGGSSITLQLPGGHLLPHTSASHPQELVLSQRPQHASLATSIANLPHHFAPGTMPIPPPLPHTAADRTEALLPIPHVIPSVTPLTATNHSSHSQLQQLNNRREIVCRYFVAGQGHCPYGEKCWFAHLDQVPNHQQDFSYVPQTTVPSSPLQIQVPTQAHMWNPSLPNVPMHFLASPPQSPLSGYLAPTDPSSAVRTPILHSTPPYPFPGQAPILVWRGPRNFPLLPSIRPPLTIPTDPRLRFTLLSEVDVHSDSSEGGTPVQNISQLATRADHFYISFNSLVRDYKILFSGHQSCQQSWSLQDTFTFTHRVTCIHTSRQQQYLLLVGTEAGTVYSCSLRRGNMQYGQSSIITHICTVEPPEPVTSLVHFSTSISLAQVVVVGTQIGTVSWYIAQPPQKTYSLLSCSQPHFPRSVVDLQVWGGMLVSGSREGKLIVWSMRTQQPAINSEQYVHSASLSNIHIQDSSVIITVGRGSAVQKDSEGITVLGKVSSSAPTSLDLGIISTASISTSANGVLHTINLEGGVGSSGGVETPSVNQITQEMKQVSIGETANNSSGDTITIWQYGVPLRPTKTQRDLGEIITSVFHQAHTGNMFLALGLSNQTIKILNLPNFTLASELQFPEMAGKRCLHMALNLSRESPIPNHNYYRNPFRDLILTTVWSDGKVMICQVSRQ